MTEDIMQAYLDVERAMERYNTVLHQHVHALETGNDSDRSKLERLKGGTRAMQDSSGIYLAYAKFVAYGMPEHDDLVDDDDLQA